MKKSSLTTAVLAGIAGLVGFVGSSQAVELNPDGTGEVLIYPYYTVNSGQQTLVSVVNTADIGKAVKVRYLEGFNSREVLDFNLFLSPYDVWTSNIFALSDAGVTSDGAAVLTRDFSCTVPDIVGNGDLPELADGTHYVPFSTLEFAGLASDGGPTDVSRTREGYVELIQMSDVTGATLADITHSSGVPANCASAALRNVANTDFIEPTGGLFGAGTIIDVAEGVMYPFEADAVAGFSAVSLFSESGSLEPNLAGVNTSAAAATAYVFTGNGAIVTANYPTGSADAVSAVFMASALMNEWVADASGATGTDWVVTFPTKWYYVDTAVGTVDPAPFVEPFVGGSCTVVGVKTFDREEGSSVSTPGDDFSPRPPGNPPSSLCNEVNVVTITADEGEPSSILGSSYDTLAVNVGGYGTAGWMYLDLNPIATDSFGWINTEAHAMVPSAEGVVFSGLPATGFQATKFVNGNVGGVLSNYAGAYRHRVERSISAP